LECHAGWPFDELRTAPFDELRAHKPSGLASISDAR
jgi:hypothetical protein